MKSKFNFGDVYIVKFHPVVGREVKRFRPAVVISSITNSIDKRFVTIVPISTKYNNPDYESKLSKYSFFDKPSYSVNWYLRTVDTVRLEYKLGTLETKDKERIKKSLSKILK